MKIQPQRHENLKKIVDLVEDIDIAMLTTLAPDGRLLGRPMAALEVDAEGSFWFFTSERSAKVHQLDRVNLAFTDEDDATYVSISGRAAIVNDRGRIDDLWTAAAKPWFPQGKDDPDLVLLRVDTDIAEYWDANSSKMVRLLAMAASALSGKPVGLGEHEVVSNPARPPLAHQRSLIGD
jgi:general stress protein 26